MPGPYAVRVKTVDGWQDIALLGPAGPVGPTGPGVPVGGTKDQVLAKKSATDLDTQWVAQSGGSAGHTIQDEGVSLTARTKLNFVGAGVTAVDDVANDRTLVNIPASLTDVYLTQNIGAQGIASPLSVNGTWVLLPFATQYAMQISASDGTNPDFVQNADKSWTINKTGTYTVSLSAGIIGPTSQACMLDVRLCVKSGATPAATDWIAEETAYCNASQSSTITSPSATQRFNANDVIACFAKVEGLAANSVLASALTLGISRNGAGPQGPTGPTGGNATVPFDNLHVIGAAGEIAFGTGWGAYSQCAFRKDPLGKVMFRGTMKCTANFTFGSTNATLFTLPVGYRPADNISQKVVVFEPDGLTTSMSLCTVSIASTGAVTLQGRIAGVTTSGLSGSYVWLHELDFDTETVIAMPTGPQGAKGDPGGTMGACTFRQTASVSPGPSSGWRTLWVGSSNVIDPAGSFTRNADGTVTITDAGWYSVSASILNGTAAVVTLALTDTLNAQGTYFAVESDSVPAGYYKSIAADNYFAAGAKIYVNAWSDVSTVVSITAFQIARIGGPKGDKGTDGATPSESYVVATGGASVTCTASTQTTLPLPATFTQSSTPAPFTRNADGTMTCAITGQYSLAFNAALNTSLAAGLRCQFTIFIDGVLVGLDSGYSPWANGSAVYNGLISVGQIVRFAAYCDVTQDGRMISASAHRFGGPKGDTGATGGNATVPMDTWHVVGTAGEPAFGSAGWSANAPGLRFRKDPLGRVWIDGTAGVSGGAVSSALFTLPAGYRPKQAMTFDNLQSNGAAGTWIGITAAGVVTPSFASGSAVYIDVSFDTETVTAMPTGPQGPQGVAGTSTPIPLVTSLPVAPVNGQEIYFQSATMATLGIIWHLRYNSNSSSAYKWEFLGGRALFTSANDATAYVTGAAYQVGPALATPQLTYPLSGDYELTATANTQPNATAAAGDVRMLIYINGGAVNYGAMSGYSASIVGLNLIEPIKAPNQVAGQVVDIRFMSSISQTSMSVYDRSLRMEPIRVG